MEVLESTRFPQLDFTRLQIDNKLLGKLELPGTTT